MIKYSIIDFLLTLYSVRYSIYGLIYVFAIIIPVYTLPDIEVQQFQNDLGLKYTLGSSQSYTFINRYSDRYDILFGHEEISNSINENHSSVYVISLLFKVLSSILLAILLTLITIFLFNLLIRLLLYILISDQDINELGLDKKIIDKIDHNNYDNNLLTAGRKYCNSFIKVMAFSNNHDIKSKLLQKLKLRERIIMENT